MLRRSYNHLSPRRIIRGAVNLFSIRHCLSKIFWKHTIWNINIQYKNDRYTLQKLTKLVFAFRHWENLVSSSIYPSWPQPHYDRRFLGTPGRFHENKKKYFTCDDYPLNKQATLNCYESNALLCNLTNNAMD